MKSNTLLIVGAGILLLLMLSSFSNMSNYDFSALAATYGDDKAQRLSNLAAVLQTKGLSDLQIRLMLSQALHETGLFTDNPNYNLMDNNNNYAGIMKNSRYPNSTNAYAQYPTLDDFVNDWIVVLSMNNQPINASSPDDFVTRLKNNGYFTDAYATYDNAVNNYYNLISQTTNTLS